MTDKQIIIDGCDVSGCEHYDGVCLGNHHYKWCKDNDNCYYKQLKRKEQECEAYKMEAEEGKEINAELKAENEHLSEKEEEARHYLEEAEKFKNCVSEIKSLCYEQDLNEDFFACEILQKISECEAE